MNCFTNVKQYSQETTYCHPPEINTFSNLAKVSFFLSRYHLQRNIASSVNSIFAHSVYFNFSPTYKANKMFPRTLITTAFITLAVSLSACTDSNTETPAENGNPTAINETSSEATPSIANEAEVYVEISEEEVSTDSPEKPAISASAAVVITSKIEAINHETRVITVNDQEGRPVTFTASEEARNLDQVAVGDTVTVEVMKNLTIQVLSAENAEAGAAEVMVAARSEEGEMPAAAVMDSKIEVFTVEEINIEANTFKLKDANGMVKEFTAREPENLKKSEVGDVVVMTLTQAIAISVEQHAAE